MHATARPGVTRVEARLTDFVFPLHSHDHIVIGLLHEGALSSRYGLNRYVVEPGQLMLVNAGEVHDGRPAGRLGRRYTMLEIEAGVFRALCREANAREWIEFPRAVVDDPALRNALRGWMAALAVGESAREREQLALLLGAFASGTARPGGAAARALARSVAREMRERAEDVEGLGALAERSGASRFQLIRAFKQAYGLTPEDFRRQLRVARARALLGGRLGLADVASAAGFADQSHMTREFGRLLGCTPGTYRMALKPDGAQRGHRTWVQYDRD